jgi:hypothetical protein
MHAHRKIRLVAKVQWLHYNVHLPERSTHEWDFCVVRWKAVHRMRSDAQLNLDLIYLMELVASRGV